MTLTISQRRALVAAAGVIALLGASGVTQQHVFHQASTLKYSLTVIGPLFVCALLTIDNPLAVVTGLIVVAAPFAGSYETFQGVHIPLLVPLIVCGLVILSFSEPQAGRRSALFTGAVALVLALIIPLVESPDKASAVSDLGSLFIGAYFASRVSSRRGGFLILAWSFIGSALLQACLALWESKTGHQLNLYGTAGSQTISVGSQYTFSYVNATRPPGAFYDPISLGNMLAVAVPLGVGLTVHHIRSRQWMPVAIAAVAVAVIVAGLEVTLSRMSWIGAAAGLVVAALAFPRPVRRVLVSSLGLALVVAVLLGVFSGQSASIQRLGSITHPLSESSTGQGDVLRVQIWHRVLSIALAHPVTGVGFERLKTLLAGQLVVAGTQSHAHDTYLQLFAEGGAIALIGLLVVLLCLERDLLRLLRLDRVWGAALAGCSVALMICWLTDVTIRYSGVAMFMGMVFGMVAGRSREDAQTVAPGPSG